MSQLTKYGRHIPALCLLLAAIHGAGADEGDWLGDDEVQSIVDAGSAGVFYAWSPHMPLSVDGLAEIFEAGEKLGLEVIPLLSSHSNVAYARDRIAGKNYPDSVLGRSRSATLIERDLFIHAPAIVIFDGGRFVSPVLPGFRYASDYEELIGRFLASARQETD